MARSTIALRIGLLVLVLLLVPGAAAAQSDDLARALEDMNVLRAKVSFTDVNITIAYHETIATLGPWESVLYRIANIIAVADDHSSNDLPVVLHITYDDGNIMQISGSMDDAADFLDGEFSPDDYEAKLTFQPITRGPVVVDAVCDAAQGDNCTYQDACGCYPNESCEPEDDAADVRGCVVSSEPENALLQNGLYVCAAHYVWNEDLTACELPLSCPSGTFAFNGECVSRSSSAANTDYDDYGGGYKPLGGLVGLCGAALCLLVPVVLVVVLVLRRRKRRRAEDGSSDQTPAPVAAPTSALRPEPVEAPPSAPTPLPPHPVLPEAFLALERRHSQLRQSFAAGQISQEAYRQALQQLVVQDERGHWAYSSGQWMWFDGTQWVTLHP
ncbi:MAG: hypothetical protein MUQ10_12095 [Anaerolineae bacterium]|nr:hypothetical protein [Anaerolineae bacterium]